jgi:uncharacterized protein
MKRQLLPILLLLLLPALAFAQPEFDETKALAEQGDARAQNTLGYWYMVGLYNGIDMSEALKWYRLSAKQGNVDAQFQIGFMYDTGEGLPQNFIRAYVWYSLSAIGDRQSAFRDEIASLLTPEQLATGQELATKCFESDFKDCPF